MPEKYYYDIQWPENDLYVTCYAHDLFNFRYHWHDSEYEIDIILKGKAEFCSGNEIYSLEENDVILINPGVFHASFSTEEDSKALVLRFSEKAFSSFLGKYERLNFLLKPSDQNTRDLRVYKMIRYYSALLLKTLASENRFSSLIERSSMEMLLSELCMSCDHTIFRFPEYNENNKAVIGQLLNYIDEHYAEKLSLDDISKYIRYNRTYVSTLFKNVMGTNFHNYLTKKRLSHALFELGATDKAITQIVMDCGFTDLKAFNKTFRDIFHYLPTEYRQRLNPNRIIRAYLHQIYVSPDEDPAVCRKLGEYLSL